MMKHFLLFAVLSLFVGVAYVQENFVTTKSGLKYKDIQVGTGEEAKKGMTVSVHYTGWLQSNGKKFDSFLAAHQGGSQAAIGLDAGPIQRSAAHRQITATAWGDCPQFENGRRTALTILDHATLPHAATGHVRLDHFHGQQLCATQRHQKSETSAR